MTSQLHVPARRAVRAPRRARGLQAGICGLGALTAMTIGAPIARAQALSPAPTPAPDAAPPTVRLSDRVYGGVDYLYWWVKNAPLSVPLISTGPVANHEGFLVNANTAILYGAPLAPATGGNNSQSYPGFSGARLTAGYWLDDAHRTALEASAFKLQRQTTTYSASGGADGSTGLRIPVFNSIPYKPGGGCDPDIPTTCLVGQIEDGTPVSVPGELTGKATARNSLELWGADLSGVIKLYSGPGWEVSGLAGLRVLALDEGLGLTNTIVGLSAFYQNQSGTSNDSFKTMNRFYGAGLGLRGRYVWGPYFAEATARVALGDSHEVLSVQGAYVDYNAPFAATSGPYGTFAMPANEGKFTRDNFAVVPEAQIKFGYSVTPSLRLTIGYDVLYDSNVIRPGDQISRYVPKGQTFQQDGTSPSLTSPVRLFRTTDFYAQGLSAGVNFTF